jgi:hypothetical protein
MPELNVSREASLEAGAPGIGASVVNGEMDRRSIQPETGAYAERSLGLGSTGQQEATSHEGKELLHQEGRSVST